MKKSYNEIARVVVCDAETKELVTSVCSEFGAVVSSFLLRTEERKYILTFKCSTTDYTNLMMRVGQQGYTTFEIAERCL